MNISASLQRIFSERGRDVVLLPGFKCRKDRESRRGETWRCTEKACKQRMYVNDRATQLLYSKEGQHDHEAVMNPGVIPEPHISSYHGTNGKSMEDIIAEVDLNFAGSASRNKPYTVEDPSVKVNYICAEDSITYAEPLPYRASNSTDEPKSACAELSFVQPTYRKRGHSEGNPETIGMISKNNWINKNDVNIVQPLPKRISVVRESHAEDSLNFGQFTAKSKAKSEINSMSTGMNSGEDAPAEEDTRFVEPVPGKRTYSERNLVFDGVRCCKCPKGCRDIHSSFGEYVTYELRTLHDPVALLLLKKKINDAIYETKMTILRNSQSTPNYIIPHGHHDSYTPEPSPGTSKSSETSFEYQSCNNVNGIKQEIIGEDWIFNAQ